MPNLQSFTVLDKRVRKYMSDYSLGSLGLAFQWVVLELLLGLNSSEIDETIVDEGMDGGIDALCVSDTDVHVFTCTYAETFENAARNFPQNKLDSLIVTIEKILSKRLTEREVNPLLWEKVKDVWSLLSAGTPTFIFYVVSNKEKPTQVAVDRFEGSLRPFRFVKFDYLDLEDVVTAMLRVRHRPVDGAITFIGRSHFQKSDGPLKATVATVDAAELITLISDPSDDSRINEEIFNDNVRVDLGLRNAINKGILDSALEETNYEFWYLNNGIMLVCDECNYVPGTVSPRATLKNVQIVNGGQTSRTLFHAYKRDPAKVGNVDVLVRVVETRDRTISERICETANRQTPVRSRDLRANDWIQRKLEEEFLTLGYHYERKKNQHADKLADTRLDCELLAQLALAFYFELPSEARNSKSIVFGEEYRRIFNEDTVTASYLLLPYRLHQPLESIKKTIQQRKRRNEPIADSEAFISLATFHILYAIRLVAECEEIDLQDSPTIDGARAKAVELVLEVVQHEMPRRGELYTHDRFFKQKQTNSLIRDHVLQAYDKQA